MNEKNTQTLFDRYPRLYRGRTLSLQENLMSRGFCCGDGWFDLIDAFSARIEAESDRLREAEGWEEADLPMATQVKEKLGTLRFHVRPRTPEILEIFRAAFEASQHICELCGESKIMGRCPAGCAEFCD